MVPPSLDTHWSHVNIILSINSISMPEFIPARELRCFPIREVLPRRQVQIVDFFSSDPPLHLHLHLHLHRVSGVSTNARHVIDKSIISCAHAMLTGVVPFCPMIEVSDDLRDVTCELRWTPKRSLPPEVR